MRVIDFRERPNTPDYLRSARNMKGYVGLTGARLWSHVGIAEPRQGTIDEFVEALDPTALRGPSSRSSNE